MWEEKKGIERGKQLDGTVRRSRRPCIRFYSSGSVEPERRAQSVGPSSNQWGNEAFAVEIQLGLPVTSRGPKALSLVSRSRIRSSFRIYDYDIETRDL